ncbi:hypothetical protein HOLleu_42330 [Holothuria leucospilota]|uniref:Uncharacterized protein n=1 Tax=Holothuria leucospilota TaxID=206669 RepID=A0A9Q0YCY9_HOLLE|nr:hypothetical protein HOLleu_42330 [Holothuria leucospilota]
MLGKRTLFALIMSLKVRSYSRLTPLSTSTGVVITSDPSWEKHFLFISNKGHRI